jgi:hypothetical protein
VPHPPRMALFSSYPCGGVGLCLGVGIRLLSRLVYRTARIGLRTTAGQRRRCFGLLRSAGDVWACVLEVNWWRRRRGAPPLVSYQELCRELAAAGAATFGELDSVGARSVLRRVFGCLVLGGQTPQGPGQ